MSYAIRDEFIKKYMTLAEELRPDMSYEELVSEIFGAGLAEQTDFEVQDRFADFVIRHGYCEDGGKAYNAKLKKQYDEANANCDIEKAESLKHFKDVFNRYYPE